MTRRQLTPKGHLGVVAELERQSKALRKMADAWRTTGKPPVYQHTNGNYTPHRLTHADLTADADQLMADAKKLRKMFS